MEIPSYLNDLVLQNINNEANVIEQNYQAAQKRNSWAVVYGLVPFKDGNQWCVLLGKDIQEGICGFGDTPVMAIYNFDKMMGSCLQP